MKKCSLVISLIILMAFLAGCGETINGAVKDTKRVRAGIRKIFIRD